MYPARPTATTSKKCFTSLKRRSNLVGNYGPPSSPHIKFETSTVTIEKVDSPGPHEKEPYQLTRPRKALPAFSTIYGDKRKFGKYDCEANGSWKQLVVGANLEEAVADTEITYEQPYYVVDPEDEDGGPTGDVVVMESYEVKPDYNNILSSPSPGSSCSGGTSSNKKGKRKRKSVDQLSGLGGMGMGLGSGTGWQISHSQYAALMKEESIRTKKMYELDPVENPHAAPARASYRNRLLNKMGHEQMVADLAFYKSGYERLEIENEQLKETIHEMRYYTNATEWLKFFRNAGIVKGTDIEYANLFEQQRMKPSMLVDFDANLLRGIGITAFGDIHLIIKHAKSVFEQTQGRSLFIKQSVQHPPSMLMQQFASYKI